MQRTLEQFEQVVEICREVFTSKMKDYGCSWRILRLESVTDQLLIKASRIRNIEITGVHKINDDIKDEFIGLVNYAVIGLIQFELGTGEKADFDNNESIFKYNEYLAKARKLMMDKNHDYGEIWRKMRVSSYTDLILMKIHRIKQIEDNQGGTLVSEGVDSNFYDIINYSVFGLIKLLLE